MFLGSRAAAAPYILASKLFTALYFAYFLVILPTLALVGEFSAKEIEKVTVLRTPTANFVNIRNNAFSNPSRKLNTQADPEKETPA